MRRAREARAVRRMTRSQRERHVLTKDRLRLIRRRLIQVAPVIVLATFIVFGLQQLVPGDIAVTLAGENATDARIAEIRTLYGLDRPFLVQYGHWLWGALHGDLGKSLLSGEVVLDSILRRFPISLLIVGCALTLSLSIGIPLGILAATRPGSRVDAFVTVIASLGVALPNFWLAMLLVATFALNWTIFPATGAKPLVGRPRPRARCTPPCRRSRSRPAASPRSRGSCAARWSRSCRRNMSAPCTPKACRRPRSCGGTG